MNGTYSATGYGIVRDLLDRWITQNRHPKLVPTARSMVTPILGADKGGAGGVVLWLTVELLPCKDGVFCPDPVFLGLTSITHSETQQDLCQAMQDVWTDSGLACWFRGRWRIQSMNPSDPQGASPPLEIPQLFGRSIQAAALCALLAASGDPYREKKDQQPTGDPDPLELNVAISATLGVRDPQKPLSEMPLGQVSSVPAKLEEARKQYQMDTVLLATSQAVLSPEIDELLKQMEEARREHRPHNGMFVEKVENLDQALDTMLVTNRYHKAYQADVRIEWLQDWEFRTARFEGDVGDGPDKNNLPVKTPDEAIVSAAAAT